jgi:hypothetical protein
MSKKEEKDYYIKKKRILMRQFDAALSIIKNVLIEYFGETKFQELATKANKEFENILPQIPYVGGKENDNTDDLINSAFLLPLVRIFEEEGLNFYENSKLTYTIFEAFYKVLPPTDDIFSEEFIIKKKEGAKTSKLRRYPGDWVYDFVQGDNKNFTYGINYSECSVYKFYKSQGLEHLMPIICVADYARAQAYGYGLKRTQSIGNGASMCDFRYIKNGSTSRGWPLDTLLEFKKSKK